MKDRDYIRLEHMLKACENILLFIKDRKKIDIARDLLLNSAIQHQHQLQILGEAANAVSNETQNKASNIPWRQIVGLRNRLIHEYFDVDIDIIWVTIKEGLPQLILEIRKHLSHEV